MSDQETPSVPAISKAEVNFCLDDHIARVLRTEPFFASFSRNIIKVPNKSIKTAGVAINRNGFFVLMYSPEFMASLPDKQIAGVLIHEFWHIILLHILDRMPAAFREIRDERGHLEPSKMTDAMGLMFKAWNHGADLSINCHIVKGLGRDALPEFVLLPGEASYSGFASEMSAEWYFAEIMKDPKKFMNIRLVAGAGDGSIDGQFDDHGSWGSVVDEDGNPISGESAARDIARERARQAAEKAVNRCVKGNSWGSISAEMRKEIMALLQNRVEWRKVLRWFIQTSQRADHKRTPRRINKKYPFIHPGTKVLRVPEIAISIDQSGSVSDQMLELFFGALNGLASLATFTVIPFDCSVIEDEVYVWKKGQRRIPTRVANGGTDFNAPTKFVNERAKFDGHIILTDMCAPAPVPSKIQRLWMTDAQCAKEPYFKTSERVVVVDK